MALFCELNIQLPLPGFKAFHLTGSSGAAAPAMRLLPGNSPYDAGGEGRNTAGGIFLSLPPVHFTTGAAVDSAQTPFPVQTLYLWVEA